MVADLESDVRKLEKLVDCLEVKSDAQESTCY
jgi:hypothetical protein